MKNEKTMHILLLRHYIIMPMLEEKAAPFLRFKIVEKKIIPRIVWAKRNLHFYSSRMQMRIFFFFFLDDYQSFYIKPMKDHRKGKQKIGENILISFPSFGFFIVFCWRWRLTYFFFITQLHDFDKKNCFR